jgi:ATP-dependent DNA helicase RecQ
MNPLIILKQKFGYEKFRHHQEAIIDAVLKKKDTFALMPTGGGKSLCYQIPALLMDGLTIVISPLIALMKDQVDALRVNGIEAAFINSTQSYNEQEQILQRAKAKKLKLLYLAPERLLGNSAAFLKTLTSFEINLIAIDEAHCISHWGHDFRPEYLMLAQLRQLLPGVPMIAVTATADKLTRKDIIEKLELKNPELFISSFNRANIRYNVQPKVNSFEKLLEFLNDRREQSGIIYCLSRASTERLAEDLTQQGYAARPYHAGLERQQRTRHQDMFLRDEIKIVVATIAFGMGIDKSNVRYVVHMDLPKNIESYYQETGRAGRDGDPSDALLFYSSADVVKLKRFAVIEGNDEQNGIALKKLDQMSRFGELTTCRRKYLLNYFDERFPEYCGNCDVCLSTYELFDATVHVQKVISAIIRLQQKYGANYIIDFLRGSGAAKIQDDHKALKTFGVGSDLSKPQWQAIIRELLDREYLEKTVGQYPVLRVTSKSNDVLNGEKVMLVKSRETAVRSVRESEEIYETELYRRIKEVRNEMATEANVLAHIVISEATLVELSKYLPIKLEDLERISGFGQAKIEKYGQAFVDCIAEYCEEQNLQSRIHLKDPKRLRKETVERDNETKQITLKLFREGKTEDEISILRNLSKSTIEAHLAFYVRQQKIKVDQVVPLEKYTMIEKAINVLGCKALAPIKESVGASISYGEIRYVIAHLEASKVEDPQPAYERAENRQHLVVTYIDGIDSTEKRDVYVVTEDGIVKAA